MPLTPRKIAFITAATDHGTFIVNRFDYNFYDPKMGYGVGYELLDKSSREPAEISTLLRFLDLRRKYFGDGVFAIDCGANIGIHTVECAKHMTSWGSILAIEAQERIFYALAGNISINNCFNARALQAAVTTRSGKMRIPTPDYLTPASFGSLELIALGQTEFIGQEISYSENNLVEVQAVSLDSFGFKRLDLIKIDVEGMEFDVLEGASQCIANYHPIIVVEWFKSDKGKLKSWLERLRYVTIEDGLNFVAVHQSDNSLRHIKIPG
jgi:FkbM family methyltransferase